MINPGDYIEGEIDNLARRSIETFKRVAVALVCSLIRPLATTTEVFLRRELGERYFTGWNFLGGIFLIWTVITPPDAARAALAGERHHQFTLHDWSVMLVAWTWLISFVWASIRLSRRIRKRITSGILWHSYSCGYSIVGERTQPFVPMALGVVLCCFGIWGPGVLMILSGLVSRQMRAVEAARFYARVLDTLDAQIESEQLSTAVMERSNGKSTSGVRAPLPAYFPNTQRQKFLQTVRRPSDSPARAPVDAQAEVVQPAVAPSTTPLSTDDAAAQISQNPQVPSVRPASPDQPLQRPQPSEVLRGGTQILQRFGQMTRGTGIRLLIGVMVLTLVVYTIVHHVNVNRALLPTAVRAAVEQKVSVPSARLVDVSTTVTLQPNDNDVIMRFTATMESTEPLYTQIPVASYLNEIGADAGDFDRLKQILNGPGADWIRSDAGVTGDIASVTRNVLIRESTKVKTHFNVTGDARATRPVKDWEVEVGNVQADVPEGSPRGQFTGNVLLLDRPEDVQKFKNALADAKAALVKLEQSQRIYQAKVTKEQDQHRQGLLARLAPGSLFAGSASQGTQTPQPLWLEITDVDPDRKTLRAWLRNDGGWNDTRRFEGTFVIDDTGNQASVTLKTDSSQMLQNCGPFLEWNETYQWTLKLDGDSLTGTSGSWSYRFAYLADDAKKQSEIATVTDTATEWLAATKAGTVYKVTASIPSRAWSEEYYMSFTKQEKDGMVIEAVLESPGRGYRRSFSGTLITNKYKADHKPLRLFTPGANVVREANSQSPLAFGYDYYLYPQLDDGRMRMNADGVPWQLEFVPATPEELVKARLSSVPSTLPTLAAQPEGSATLASPSNAISPVTGSTQPDIPVALANIDVIRAAAAKGDAAAQSNLGMAYLTGTGVSKDATEAQKWLRMAADQGNAVAQYGLGTLNTNGNKVSDEGVQWFQKSAQQGYAPAQFMMGRLSIHGQTVSPEGMKWLSLAADQGHAGAQYTLATAYFDQKNYPDAEKWYRKAADQGDAPSQVQLGCLFANGQGVRKDPAEAAKWFQKAADQNDKVAQFNLANLYLDGIGVSKDPVKAFELMRKAAEQGDAEAEWNLGVMYSDGSGVAKDEGESLKWIRSAARHGDADAQSELRSRQLTW